jgi:hypothetical protein
MFFLLLIIGKVIHGLKVHPDRQHIIYPLGCAVVIEDISGNGRPTLLWGHTDEVTCISISNRSGHLIASGQKTYMGFKVWKSNNYVNSLHAYMALGFFKHTKSLIFVTKFLFFVIY